jgi:serine/threonine-protein kinase
VILYEMLTGRLPFQSNDPEELARLHRDALPASPRRLNYEIPDALDQIILKVLAKEPSQRYRSADQLGRVLRTILQRPENYANTAVSSSNGATTVVSQAAATRPSPGVTQARPSAPPLQGSQPVRVYTPPAPQAPAAYNEPEDSALDIDWVSVFLGLLAALAVGGLVPLWLYIFQYWSLNPLVP